VPTIPYVNAAGQRVPGVTTIIGTNLGWSKDGLKHWAWKLGTEGKHYRDATNWAATVGTVAHALVEAHIRGIEFVPPEGATPDMIAKGRAAFSTYLDWQRFTRLKIVATETPFVSERYQYGGCPDAVAVIDGGEPGLHMPDWKSSNGTYADHIIQLAAYGAGFEEVTGMPIDGFHLCRFDKLYGNFSHKYYPRAAMAKPWRAFLRLRDLHELKGELEAMAK
jgi:hypothetical protein